MQLPDRSLNRILTIGADVIVSRDSVKCHTLLLGQARDSHLRVQTSICELPHDNMEICTRLIGELPKAVKSGLWQGLASIHADDQRRPARSTQATRNRDCRALRARKQISEWKRSSRSAGSRSREARGDRRFLAADERAGVRLEVTLQ
jgi:hypothetical protein